MTRKNRNGIETEHRISGMKILDMEREQMMLEYYIPIAGTNKQILCLSQQW